MSATPAPVTTAGVFVRDKRTGKVGITTDGVNRNGRMGVMFEGGDYSVVAMPDELERIDGVTVTASNTRQDRN